MTTTHEPQTAVLAPEGRVGRIGMRPSWRELVLPTMPGVSVKVTMVSQCASD